MQRFLAHPIPRQDQAFATLIPDCNGKHSIQELDRPRAEFLEEMYDDLGIRMGPESMASFLQSSPEVHKIVDFAVEDNPKRLILIADRLMASRNIDDAQTA
jgi:hypothetical protein